MAELFKIFAVPVDRIIVRRTEAGNNTDGMGCRRYVKIKNPDNRDLWCESFSQFDSLPLTYLTRSLGCRSIPFHRDVSLRTLHVPLVGEERYAGGRLTFATTQAGITTPRRPAGSYTLHDNTIAHGVTKLTSGVRYGLFFLHESVVH